MAKSREQVLQDQLGFLAFQLAIATADLEAAREELAIATADLEAAREELAALKAAQEAALQKPAPES